MSSFDYAFGKVEQRLLATLDGRLERGASVHPTVGGRPRRALTDRLVGSALYTARPETVEALLRECGDTRRGMDAVGYLKAAEAEGFENAGSFRGPIGSDVHLLARREDAVLVVLNVRNGVLEDGMAFARRTDAERRDFMPGFRHLPSGEACLQFGAEAGLRIKLGLVTRNGTAVGRWHSLDEAGNPIFGACADEMLVSRWERRHCFDYYDIAKTVTKRAAALSEPWATIFDVKRRLKRSDIPDTERSTP